MCNSFAIFDEKFINNFVAFSATWEALAYWLIIIPASNDTVGVLAGSDWLFSRVERV
jgi:hypothetical protein